MINDSKNETQISIDYSQQKNNTTDLNNLKKLEINLINDH